jgi:NADH-quinone oxidoreductase subunit F
LLDENITLRCGTALGRDVTLDSLFNDGFKAIFVAIGAHKSLRLQLKGEDLPGVFPSIQFLKAFNIKGERLAKGRVGIIGGGNSALDAARVALRQPNVTSVTIFYRRTREEMPAFAEEVEAALEEGIKLETLVSPTGILSEGGRLSGVEFIRNELGDIGEDGRRRPVPVPGSQSVVSLDTLIVAISEGSDVDCVAVAGANRIDVDEKRGMIRVDPETLCTNRPGVFAGGDVVTGPNTVVDAIAAGKKVAVMIDRYLRGEELKQPAERRIPRQYVEPSKTNGTGSASRSRIGLPRMSAESRKRGFAEVELTLSEEEAVQEAGRCLRCDLEFTQPQETGTAVDKTREQFA